MDATSQNNQKGKKVELQLGFIFKQILERERESHRKHDREGEAGVEERDKEDKELGEAASFDGHRIINGTTSSSSPREAHWSDPLLSGPSRGMAGGLCWAHWSWASCPSSWASEDSVHLGLFVGLGGGSEDWASAGSPHGKAKWRWRPS